MFLMGNFSLLFSEEKKIPSLSYQCACKFTSRKKTHDGGDDDDIDEEEEEEEEEETTKRNKHYGI
jgi:hypothetical protein